MEVGKNSSVKNGKELKRGWACGLHLNETSFLSFKTNLPTFHVCIHGDHTVFAIKFKKDIFLEFPHSLLFPHSPPSQRNRKGREFEGW